MSAGAVILPFPTLRRMTAQERALIARWAAAARGRGIANVYVSARKEDDPAEVQDRIVVVERPGAPAAFIVHRPERRWIVASGNSPEVLGSFAALSEALNTIRPVLT